ncbi:MAG: hypothetical protein KF872_09975 [Chitinophagales bacterium]|nr:hypothetical protein [Chitinophagales bacterium]
MKIGFTISTLLLLVIAIIGCAKEREVTPNTTKQVSYNGGSGNSSGNGTNIGGKPTPGNGNPALPPSHTGTAANCNSCHKGKLGIIDFESADNPSASTVFTTQHNGLLSNIKGE